MNGENWRVLLSQPETGAWNMALDEAILEAVIMGVQPPTLRLYGWNPACLSLGHAQPASDVDLPSLEAHGWQLVRRPTGGRAILHTDELTYSICARQDHSLMVGGILESYRRISKGLILGLTSLGVNANADSQYQLPIGSTQNAPVCFEVPSNYEITAGGKKLIGSAQARKNGGVLQHGSLPLYGDLTRIIDVLHFPDKQAMRSARSRLMEHAVTVENILGLKLTWDQAAKAYIDAFTITLGIEFEESSVSLQEMNRAGELVREKYGSPGWTLRI